MQTVYPTFHKRVNSRCSSIGCPPCRKQQHCDEFYIYDDAEKLARPKFQNRLQKQWKRHFNQSASVWIQKTPTFDVILLDRMIESAQILVMRHPLQWSPGTCMCTSLETWMQTWHRVLHQLKPSGNVKKWIITRYEGIAKPGALAPWADQACEFTSLPPSRHRRHLHEELGLNHILPTHKPWAWPKNSPKITKVSEFLVKWFQYRIAPPPEKNASGIVGAIPFVWASNADRGPLDNPQFWTEWNTAYAEFIAH